MFPPKGGIGSVSPQTLMTGMKLDYKKHCQFPFGSYVQVHKEPTPTNSPAARTIGAITLGTTGNLQGGYKFLNLQTGKKITRRNWTHLPMPIELTEGVCTGVPPCFTFKSVTTAYACVNGEQLSTMAQHVPTKRRNRIRESKNLDNGDKVGLQETLSIAFRFLHEGTRRTNPH